MATIAQQTDDIVLATRWVARILALLLAFFTAVLVLSTGISLTQLETRNVPEMVAFFIIWIGLLAGWRSDGIGGALIIGGVALFLIFDYAFFGSVLRFWVFLIFALPGGMLLYCWWRCRQEAKSRVIEKSPSTHSTVSSPS